MAKAKKKNRRINVAKLKKRIKKPSRKTQVILLGLGVAIAGYVWARITFDDNVANNTTNTFAGYAMIFGGIIMILGLLESRFEARSQKKTKTRKK